MRRRELIKTGMAAATIAAAPPMPGDTIRLANAEWQVKIDPATLAITATPAGAAPIRLSRGVPGQAATAIESGPAFARWQWQGHRLACALDGADLTIRVEADAPGTLALIDQPPEAHGDGLIYPLGEGYLVPPGDATWRAFLTGRDRARNTNEDLALPLWGVIHGAHGFHWLCLNPYGNELRFEAEGEGLALAVTHSFSPLDPGTPIELLLHFAGPNPLAGAKRYRKHLQQTGEWRTLVEKIAATPSAEKLIGATHCYLWGNDLLGEPDVRDWPGFAARLRGDSPLAVRLRAKFEEDIAGPLAKPAQAWARRTILRAVNGALRSLASAAWQQGDVIDPSTIVAAFADLRREVIATFGPVLAPDPATWGSGHSRRTYAALEAAGLERLWIGLDGWEGGLWLPEATRAGVDAGYLIGTYDSYETANAPGVRPDWSTAQLGAEAHASCGVINADGTTRAGFQKSGVYTNARCVLPILKDRVPVLAKAGGFNSWFLDVYATGMVFDDYRPGHHMTKAENARVDIDSCRWVSETLQLPCGSEDAKAVGTPGVLFGHGIETPVFGWGDPDMQKDPKSPFFLGAWYPPEAPAIHFKQVPVKEPYRTVYFAPQTRLPLYQAAFHGAVIVSHHWSYDQLKFANVMPERALAQQLYNVPALFHLSATTLAERLPALRRHDAFFRPLHLRLAKQTLEGFDWLSDDRLLQQTRFADGTRLIANFAADARRTDGIAIPAHSVVAIIDGKPGAVFTA